MIKGRVDVGPDTFAALGRVATMLERKGLKRVRFGGLTL
jgi:hypothetical protein